MSDIREDYKALKNLLESRGWELLMKIAEAQILSRHGTILDQMRPGEEYEREFLKGECSGIQTFKLLPETIVEQLERDLEKENENVRNET